MLTINKDLVSESKYRPEIDGLRAIAVISVIFFHSGFELFSGGFVGVDVFFVISGFLITKLIITDILLKQFSISKFYLHRAKRLLPALINLVLFVLLSGCIFFDFLTFKSLGKEIIACIFYISNILYWKDLGYFDVASIQKPLLHTWTLSIEEQFYLLFPLLLIIISKSKKIRIEWVLFLIFLISISLNLYFVSKFPSATFYLLPTRIWEFLSGSLLVFISEKKIALKYQKLLFALGLFLIGYSVCFLSKSNYPGINALIPVSGTLLTLYFGNKVDFFLVKIIKCNFFLLIGKISYSLYLWHWPIIVLYTYVVMRDLVFFDFAILFISIFFISFFSWKYVEQKFRYFNENYNKLIGISLIFLSFTLSIIGLVINRGNGIPSRSIYNNFLVEAFNDPFWENISQNEIQISKQEKIAPVLLGKKVNKPNFILWGDSHARAIAFGLDSFAKLNNISGYLFSYSATPPILNVKNLRNTEFDMKSYNSKIFDFIKKNDTISNIILCSRWGYYIKDFYDDIEILNSPIFIYDSSKITDKKFINREIFFKSLESLINKLNRLKKNVYIVTPLPELTQDVRVIIGNFQTYNFLNLKPNQYFQSKSSYYEKNRSFFDFLRKFSKNDKVHLLNVHDVFYQKGFSAISDDRLLYRDKNHLSKFGSIYVFNIFDKIL